MLQKGSVVCQGTYSRIEKDKQVAFSFLSQAKQDPTGEKHDEDAAKVYSDETFNLATAVQNDRERVDLEDEEEDRMVGTVKFWSYWKYFRAALPTFLTASLAIFFAIVQGLEVIRSSEMEEDFLQKLFKYQDKNTTALIMLKSSIRWLSFRGDLLSNLLVTSVSAGALFAMQSPALADRTGIRFWH
ncbi:hypothetical protein OS493_013549 [Desmophyllum pertusum]|uniref:ABC transmembrane type-1 domain-containing protein n=1 Tax=Desmophyllum pertusum TaxID=174260 RepID=A0A9X0A2G8_9CNID|nr:hypothetical protein OS493_013549 [Desmophyllum pertusum]